MSKIANFFIFHKLNFGFDNSDVSKLNKKVSFLVFLANARLI